MADRLILETTFLVDLEREHRAGAEGPATRFLREHPSSALYITMTTAGGLATGLEQDERPHWQRLLGRFTVLEHSLDTCWAYGRAFAHLRDNGMLIGSNDLWIAAAAIAHDLPLVTRNARHFRRVPSLRVLAY
ncbi:MAG TPA: type II toxin-antitoxin system VapC family toxin [Longimicrobiales bacterium]|nr:type II toxin-antitoxin system VapC family toxin [Longimicrobiales bacterium]